MSFNIFLKLKISNVFPKLVSPKLMIGPGDQDIKRHTEIVDLRGNLTSCPDISSYPISLNYAGVGTFVDGRGLICGGYNDYNSTLESHTSTDSCFSWNSKVHVHTNTHTHTHQAQWCTVKLAPLITKYQLLQRLNGIAVDRLCYLIKFPTPDTRRPSEGPEGRGALTCVITFFTGLQPGMQPRAKRDLTILQEA